MYFKIRADLDNYLIGLNYIGWEFDGPLIDKTYCLNDIDIMCDDRLKKTVKFFGTCSTKLPPNI